MRIVEKIVEYHKYCGRCAYRDVKDTNEPCNTCLTHPFNVNSSKPIKFEERK